MDDFQDSFSGSGIEGNSSLTCAATTLQSLNTTTTLPTALSITMRVVQVLYACLILFAGVFLNCFILFLIAKFEKLRTVSFAVAFQISLCNLLQSFVIGITFIVTHSAGRWLFGPEVCILLGFCISFFSGIRNLLILVFAVDMFLYVFTPFFYRKFDSRIAATLCVLSWCLCLAVYGTALPGLKDCYSYASTGMICISSPRCPGCQTLITAIAVGTIGLPSFLLIGIFIALYIKGQRLRLQSRTGQPKDSTLEWKSLITFILLFLSVILNSLLSYSMLFIGLLLGDIPRTIMILISSSMASSLVLTDPIIILRNRNVRDAIQTLRENFKKKYFKHHSVKKNEDVEVTQRESSF